MNEYKSLDDFYKSSGISKKNLIKIYEIESYYNEKISIENDKEKRKELCSKMYNEIHPLMGSKSQDYLKKEKEFRVLLFKNFLKDRSILDVGCGNGNFLKSIRCLVTYKKLVGVDLFNFIPREDNITFLNQNIVDFNLNEKFDIVFSDNVIEHIPFQDLQEHLLTLKNHLNDNGKLIIITPNNFFGPHDITRIIDNSYKGKIKAKGSHLNEMSYTEFYEKLSENGFKNCFSRFPLLKIKNKVFAIRLPIKIFLIIEKNKFLLNILYRIGIKKPIYKMPIILICEK